MALLKYGIAVAQISGTIGGNVFARNKGGNYIRKWSKPTSTPTIKQTLTRNLFAQSNAMWRNLTNAQRNDWGSLAEVSQFMNRLGEKITLSGIAVYIKAQMPLLVANQTLTVPIPDLVNAPASFLAPDPVKTPISVAINTTGSVMDISAAELVVPAGVIFIIEATKDLPPTLINVSNKFVQILALNAGDSFNGESLTAAYLAQFGTFPDLGNRVVFKFRALDTTNGIYSDAGLQVESVTAV